jgi:hypothetical protein
MTSLPRSLECLAQPDRDRKSLTTESELDSIVNMILLVELES